MENQSVNFFEASPEAINSVNSSPEQKLSKAAAGNAPISSFSSQDVTYLSQKATFNEAISAMKNGSKSIVIDNLVGATSTDLVKIQYASKKNGVVTQVNHRLDQSVKDQLDVLMQKKQAGFALNFVSISMSKNHNSSLELFALLFKIFENCGDDIMVKSLKASGINWLTDNETQIMVCNGHAVYQGTGQKIMYQLNFSQLGQAEGVTEVSVKMNNSQETFDTKIVLPKVIGETAEAIDLDSAIQVVRMAELSALSYKQDSKQINDIFLSAYHFQEKYKWISLGAGAGINGEALVEALEWAGNSGLVIGCMTGYKSDPIKFVERFPQQPAVPISSVDEIKEMFSEDEPLMFYYPANPSQARDDRSLDLLKHFHKALVLGEKPSHGNTNDALAFKKSLEDNQIDVNRFIVGMHSPLHTSRIAFHRFVEENKDKVTRVEVFNHYPKNPNVGYERCYDPKFGGAYLDLGVYVYQQADQIARLFGSDVKEGILKASSKDIRIKYAPDKIVDMENLTVFELNGVTFHLSSKINPGTDITEEFNVYLQDNGKGSKLSFAKGCHPHDSIGVFHEKADGSVVQLANSCEPKTSYSSQIEMCQEMSKKLRLNEEAAIPSQWHTLDYQIYLLDLFDQLKKNQTNEFVY